MKKLSVVLISLIVVATLFCGCAKKGNDVDWNERVNYYQTAYYCGTVTGISVNLSCGRREKEFIIDGKITDMADFCTLTLVPLSADYVQPSYNFVLTGENGSIEGTFTKEIFGASYYAEIEKPSDIGAPTSVKITSGETVSIELPLENKMENKLTYEEVLKIAVSECADKLSEDKQESCKREISLRFAGDKRNAQNPYYWYVTIANSVEDYMALLIDPESGKVVTKKG